MKIEVVKQSQVTRSDMFDTCLIPFEAGSEQIHATLSGVVENTVKTAISSGVFVPGKTASRVLSVVEGSKIVNIVLFKCPKWTSPKDGRKVFLAFAEAFRTCRNLNTKNVDVLIDNAPSLLAPEIFGKLAELPLLVDYRFDKYKHVDSENEKARFESVRFVTDSDCLCLPKAVAEGMIVGNAGCIARDLVNEPACVLTPEEFANRVVAMVAAFNKETGKNNLTVQIFEPEEIKAMGMESFLSVGKGARKAAEPRLIVMRYKGCKDENAPVTALVGKGICYDSGGYSLKDRTSMNRMFDDMAGGAAVMTALCSAARTGLDINAVAICAACENLVSEDSYLPGDIIGSMAGKFVDMNNSDAEGRLTLIDAITYSIRRENAARVIDIATLTGAARGAVGNKTSAVLTNDDALLETAKKASYVACEKIWQLDLDDELHPQIESKVADVKNSAMDSSMGGGTISGGLFIREFVEDKPWMHVDMASVAFVRENQPWCDAGATGWGTAFLYRLLSELQGK